jgi:hypothetical protein
MTQGAGNVTRSTLTEDEQHRLFQAVGITQDTALILEVSKKLGLADSNNRATPAMESFSKAHFEWATKNVDFISEHMTTEKARQYVMAYK